MDREKQTWEAKGNDNGSRGAEGTDNCNVHGQEAPHSARVYLLRIFNNNVL